MDVLLAPAVNMLFLLEKIRLSRYGILMVNESEIPNKEMITIHLNYNEFIKLINIEQAGFKIICL